MIIEEEKLSRLDISQAQKRAWSKSYAYIVARSPFYQEHFRQAGFRPNRTPTLDDLTALSPVDKAVQDVGSYVIVACARDELSDSVEVLVVVKPGCEQCLDRLRDRSGSGPRLFLNCVWPVDLR